MILSVGLFELLAASRRGPEIPVRSRCGPVSGEPAADASSSCLCAGAGDTQATLETIREYDARHGYLLDPHTAVGVAVGRRLRAAGEPLIARLEFAHPVTGRQIEIESPLPADVQELLAVLNREGS